jgi:hypothetical protein
MSGRSAVYKMAPRNDHRARSEPQRELTDLAHLHLPYFRLRDKIPNMSTNRGGVRKRIAPKALKGEPHKAKLSIAVDADSLEWVTHEAANANISVSAVVNDAIQELKRTRALRVLLDELGTDDITGADMASALAELLGTDES